MNKMKYKLTTNIKHLPDGKCLYQIQALRDIERHGVKKGDLGGWVESEANLSQDGNAWVFDDALVFGDAKVYENSNVYGNAQVCGNAKVYGNAQVCGNAKVYGNAWVYGNARVYDDARVYDGAWVHENSNVYGNAQVFGNARVYGDAWVYENSKVYGDARVFGGTWSTSPLYIQGSNFPLSNSKPGYLQIGCLCYSYAEWIKNYKKIGEEYGFTKEEIKEYYEYIKLFAKLGK